MLRNNMNSKKNSMFQKHR